MITQKMRCSVDLQKQEGWDMECAVHGNDAAFTDRCFDIWAVTHWGLERVTGFGSLLMHPGSTQVP